MGDSRPTAPSSSTPHGTGAKAVHCGVSGSETSWHWAWTAGNTAVAQASPPASLRFSAAVHAGPSAPLHPAPSPGGPHGQGRQSHSDPGWTRMQLETNRRGEEMSEVKAQGIPQTKMKVFQADRKNCSHQYMWVVINPIYSATLQRRCWIYFIILLF